MNTIKARNLAPDYDYIMPYLLGLFVIVFPFVSAVVVTELGGELLYLIPSNGKYYASVFSGAKQNFLFCFALLGIFVFFGERIFRDNPPKQPLKALSRFFIVTVAVFVTFAVLSCLLSAHKNVVLWGFPTDAEGLISYICYIVLFLLSYNYAKLLHKREILSNALLILSGIVIIAALFEHFIVPPATLFYDIIDDRAGLALFLGNSTVFGTLCILIFPNAVIRSLKNIKFAFIVGGLVFCVVASASSAAFYAMLIEAALLLIIAIAKKLPYKRILLCGVIVIGIVIILALISNSFLGYLNSIAKNTGTYSTNKQDIFLLSGIEMSGRKIVFHSNDTSLTVSNDLGNYIFYDAKGDAVAPNVQNNIYTFEEPELSAISITDLDTVLVFDFGYGDTIEFDSAYDDFAYIGINGYLHSEITESKIPDQLQRYYSFATGRGYTWLNTLPITRQCLIVGKGAGNFPFYFPQNNVVESLNVHGTAALLNDKPHNLYIQLMVAFGLPALISFLLLTATILYKSGVKILKSCDMPIESGYAVSVAAFMICAFVNDSSVATSPLLWIYLGYLSYISIYNQQQASR